MTKFNGYTGLMLLMGVLFGPALFGQEALSKEAAVAKALEQNLGIRMARLQVEQSHIANGWGAAGALPQLGLNANLSGAVSDQSENPTSFIQERLESESINLGAQLNWVVFDGLGMFANKRALEVLVEQADGQARLMMEQTIAAVMQAYDAVQVQQRLVDVWATSVEASQERLNWVEQRAGFGAATEFDRLQLENALLSDRLSLNQQSVLLETAQRALNRLIGEPLDKAWTYSSVLAVPGPLDFPALLSRTLEDGTAMQNARITEVLARTGVQQAQSRLSPTILINAAQGDQRSQFAAGDFSGDGRSKNYSAGLVVNFNLFNGGATRRAIEQAKVQLLIAEHAELNEEQEVRRIFEDARNRWESAASSYQLAMQLSENAAKSETIADARFKSGAMNSMDFQEIHLQFLQSEQALLVILQSWLQAEIELMRLSGEWVQSE